MGWYGLCSWLSMTVESPCIQVCTLDADGICLGCYRTADEIRDWISSNNEERETILQNCLDRGA